MMKIFRIFRFGLCLVLTSCATKTVDEQSAPPVVIHVRDVTKLNYTVSAGDTVGSIATSHGMTRADLIKLNKLTPPYELYDGQKLIVTGKKTEKRINGEEVGDQIADDLNDSSQLEIKQTGGMQTEYQFKSSENSESSDSSTSTSALEDQTNDETQTAYVWPIKNGRSRITQHYSDQNAYLLIGAAPNESVYAMSDGLVKFAGKPDDESLESYGTMVIIRHQKQNKVSLYAKLNKATVKTGAQVKKGQKIGEVKEGLKGTKLYFEIQEIVPGTKDRPPVSPEKLLP